MKRLAVVYEEHTLGLLRPVSNSWHTIEPLSQMASKGAPSTVWGNPFTAALGTYRRATQSDFDEYLAKWHPDYEIGEYIFGVLPDYDRKLIEAVRLANNYIKQGASWNKATEGSALDYQVSLVDIQQLVIEQLIRLQ